MCITGNITVHAHTHTLLQSTHADYLKLVCGIDSSIKLNWIVQNERKRRGHSYEIKFLPELNARMLTENNINNLISQCHVMMPF